jgi:hypothetical protein
VDTCQLGRQRARRSSAGDHQRLVPEPVAVEENLAAYGVQAGSADAEPQVHVEAGQSVRLGQREVARAELAEQEILRQRRAVVGQVRLRADEGDRRLVSAAPQRLNAPYAGYRSADHDGAHALVGAHRSGRLTSES